MYKELHTILKIDSAYVLGIGDTGTSLTVDRKGKILESDDLRLTVQLPGGHLFILQNEQHLGWEKDEKGHPFLHIYEYRNVKG